MLNQQTTPPYTMFVANRVFAATRGGGDTVSPDKCERQRLFDANTKLHQVLNGSKSKIASVRNWNTLKRITNDYELIGGVDAGGVSRMTPISRSYFKMWEILTDHVPDAFMAKPNSMRCAFLAEGPGGFVESVATYRAFGKQTRSAQAGLGGDDADEMHCITLAQHGMPGWQQLYSRKWVRANPGRCKIHVGADGTGDLYNHANIDHFVTSVGGEQSCHLVTADGGFDVSQNYNMQEDLSLRLQVCETYAALRVQQTGGIFVLKLFDISHPNTVALVWLLTQVYKYVKIVKPVTSRPANSEKYAVCIEHIPCPHITELLRANVDTDKPPTFDEVIGIIPIPFLKELYRYNTRYTARQAHYINNTIDLSNTTNVSTNMQQQRFQQQRHIAMKWCKDHRIPCKKRYAA
jgi:hypothetical protein